MTNKFDFKLKQTEYSIFILIHIPTTKNIYAEEKCPQRKKNSRLAQIIRAQFHHNSGYLFR